MLRAILLIAVLVIAPWSAVLAQDNTGQVSPAAEPAPEAEGAPDPEAIARASAAFLAAQPAFSFGWFMDYDEVIDGREKITYVMSGENLMQRSVGMRALVERGERRRAYYYDGATFTLHAPDQAFYASAPYDGGFEGLVDALRARGGVTLPLWAIMSDRLPERMLGEPEGSAYVGRTFVGGEEAHHLAFAGADEDWQLWISTDPDRPLPLMLVGTEPRKKGWPQYRVYFTRWDLEPEAKLEDFVFVPGEDDVVVALPALTGDETAEETAEETGQ